MTYDFDVLSVTPKEIQTKYANLIERYGLSNQAKQQLAMFRDPDVTAALAGASEEVQQCFIGSGFTLNSYHSGVADTRFREGEEEARTVILQCLRENLQSLPDDAFWNDFDINAFFEAASDAQPVIPKRRTFADAKCAILPPMMLTPSSRVSSRTTTRPLSTPISGV